MEMPAANAVLTTAVDTWGRPWTPRCPIGPSGLIRWTAVDSRGPGHPPEKPYVPGWGRRASAKIGNGAARPAQGDRPVFQPVLQPRRLAMVQDLLPRGLPDVDGRQPVTMPAPDLALTELTRPHRAHPRPLPPPARPRPPGAPGACPAIPGCRSGSPPETTSTAPRPEHSSAPPSGKDAPGRTACDAPSPAGPRARNP